MSRNGARPVRTTIVFGAAAGLLTSAALILLSGVLPPWTAREWVLLACLASYGVLLCRWSGRSPAVVLLPLGVAAAALLGGLVGTGFVILCTALLAWIRSGLCFPPVGRPRMVLETFLAGGGALLAALLAPGGQLGLGMGVWVFFLIQSLYFLLVPQTRTEKERDRFEETVRELDRLLGDG